MPAMERLLGNPSKKDLELVGSGAGQCGTEGRPRGKRGECVAGQCGARVK